VARTAQAGVPTLQLRFRSNDRNAVRTEVRAAVAAVQGTPARLFINDHWQQAIGSGACGVHLGHEDLHAVGSDALAAIRRAGLRLGLGTHGCGSCGLAPGHRRRRGPLNAPRVRQRTDWRHTPRHTAGMQPMHHMPHVPASLVRPAAATGQARQRGGVTLFGAWRRSWRRVFPWRGGSFNQSVADGDECTMHSPCL
jgi:hypothetical protein